MCGLPVAENRTTIVRLCLGRGREQSAIGVHLLWKNTLKPGTLSDRDENDFSGFIPQLFRIAFHSITVPSEIKT